MTKTVVITCLYCNYTFEAIVRSKSDVDDVVCFKCGDKNVSIQAKGDVFGYDSNAPKPDAWVKRK